MHTGNKVEATLSNVTSRTIRLTKSNVASTKSNVASTLLLLWTGFNTFHAYSSVTPTFKALKNWTDFGTGSHVIGEQDSDSVEFNTIMLVSNGRHPWLGASKRNIHPSNSGSVVAAARWNHKLRPPPIPGSGV